MLTVGGLFSGQGGFERAFQRAGCEVRWSVEIDPHARAILRKRFPHVEHHEDVKAFAVDGGAHGKKVDVICGGFPCQDASLAGKRAGMAGARTGLFYEIIRLVRTLRPRYVVLENVAGLLSLGARSVFGELAACGYHCQWDCLRASDVGAPHLRDRIWIVAYLPDAAPLLRGALADSQHTVGRKRDRARGRVEGQVAVQEREEADGRSKCGGDVPDSRGCRRQPREQDVQAGQSDAQRGGAVPDAGRKGRQSGRFAGGHPSLERQTRRSRINNSRADVPDAAQLGSERAGGGGSRGRRSEASTGDAHRVLPVSASERRGQGRSESARQQGRLDAPVSGRGDGGLQPQSFMGRMADGVSARVVRTDRSGGARSRSELDDFSIFDKAALRAYAREVCAFWAEEPCPRVTLKGSTPLRRQRLKAQGNALVPQLAEFIARRIVARERWLRGD